MSKRDQVRAPNAEHRILILSFFTIWRSDPARTYFFLGFDYHRLASVHNAIGDSQTTSAVAAQSKSAVDVAPKTADSRFIPESSISKPVIGQEPKSVETVKPAETKSPKPENPTQARNLEGITPLKSPDAESHKPDMVQPAHPETNSKPDVAMTSLPKPDISARSKLLKGLLPNNAEPAKPKVAESLAKSAESLPKVVSPIQAPVTVIQPVAVETTSKTPVVEQPKPVLTGSKVSL